MWAQRADNASQNWTFCARRASSIGAAVGRDRVGDLKLSEPKTICPFLAVRDREARWPGLVWPCGSRST